MDAGICGALATACDSTGAAGFVSTGVGQGYCCGGYNWLVLAGTAGANAGVTGDSTAASCLANICCATAPSVKNGSLAPSFLENISRPNLNGHLAAMMGARAFSWPFCEITGGGSSARAGGAAKAIDNQPAKNNHATIQRLVNMMTHDLDKMSDRRIRTGRNRPRGDYTTGFLHVATPFA